MTLRSKRPRFLWLTSLLLMASAMLFLQGCPEKVPTEGEFPLQVVAQTNNMEGIPTARVLVNGSEIGKTGPDGKFAVTIRGKVNTKVTVKVVAPGGDQIDIKRRLKLQKTQKGWKPKTVRVNAFLNVPKDTLAKLIAAAKAAAGGAGTGNTGAAGAGGTDPTAGNTGNTGNAGAGNTGAAGAGNNAGAGNTAGAGGTNPTAGNTGNTGAAGAGNTGTAGAGNTGAGGTDPAGAGNTGNTGNTGSKKAGLTGSTGNTGSGNTGAATPPPPPRPSGIYKITVTSNAPGVTVRKGYRRVGKIAEAGGKVEITHKDRRSKPRKVTIRISVSRKDRYTYTEKTIKKVVEISADTTEYTVNAVFEKRPPIKIKVTSTVAGVKVKMNRKAAGEITDANTPLDLEYTGRPVRSIRLDLTPNDRKVRPRRIRKYIKIVKGTNEYSFTAEFKAPSAPPPPPPVAGGTGNTGAATPPPPPRPSGKYSITVTSNAGGIKVYKGYRYIGTIADAGGSLKIEHKDRRRKPRAVKLKFVAKDRYKFKVRTQRQTVTLSTDQDSYNVNVNYEVRPPIVIKATANVAGIRVSMNRKAQGIINDANSPLELKYTGRPTRRIRIDFKATTKGVKPRGRRVYVRVKKGVYEYNVSASFKAPAAPPPPPVGGGSGNGGALPPPPPPLGSQFKGVYKITVTSNAPNTRVYNGRRSAGTIRSAGGSVTVTYKNKSKKPRALTISLKLRNSKGYNESKIVRKVALVWGQAEYTVQGNFTKFEAAQIKVTSNIQGVTVKLNRKTFGKIVNTSQPLVIPYTGRRKRTLTVELRVPNRKLYQPAYIRKKLKFDPSVKQYTVVGKFEERVVDTPITPRCFRRKRGLHTVTVYAASGTRVVLKGECDEAVGKANKKGRIRIKMPKGTFQRVVALFRNGSRRQKVVQVSTSLTSIRFTTGSKGCNISRIKKKIRNRIRLENEELVCLRKVKRQDRQYFSAREYLARFFCQSKIYGNGVRELDKLRRIPQFYYNPYNAMAMGIGYGRCKKYFMAIRVLKQAERSSRKFAAADRRANMKSLLKAMAGIYESRYYRTKNITDLRQAHKRMQRLYEMLRSSERGERARARKEVARLRGLISKKGGGLDD